CRLCSDPPTTPTLPSCPTRRSSDLETSDPVRRGLCLCESYARVTERAALASARWLGRADQDAAEDAAFSGARLALEGLPICGRIDRKSTRLNSSHEWISYAVFCWKK